MLDIELVHEVASCPQEVGWLPVMAMRTKGESFCVLCRLMMRCRDHGRQVNREIRLALHQDALGMPII